MTTLLTMIMTVAVFIMGFGFGAISEPPADPEECKVIKIDYDPEIDESENVTWGWEKSE